MLKNLEIWATDRCNSRCIICSTWKNGANKKELSAPELETLLERRDFRGVESLQISGGEPLERKDIWDLANAILDSIPSLKKLTLTTNGTRPGETAELFERVRRKSNINLVLCVSLEGDRGINKKIRGIDSYDSAIMTLKQCRESVTDLKTMILTTLTPLNCNTESLSHIRQLAAATNSNYSFRGFYNSKTHHHSEARLHLSRQQKQVIIDYTHEYCRQNPFLSAQAEYLETGKMPLMNQCQAGVVFANIRSDGGIYPCINSRRKIGDTDRGIYVKKITDLGALEQCPCCDEACFYPMYNYAG